MKRSLLLAVVPAMLALAFVLLIAAPAHTQENPPLSGQKICLDPGHGGSDPGAVYSATTIYLEEADINLDVAYGLKALLESGGAEVTMTRTGDTYLTNSDRYTFCNDWAATILISVHTNSVEDPTWDGTQTLYFKREDKVLARAIHDVLYPQLKKTAPVESDFADFGLRRYASGVLLKSDMPAAIMEPLFMSHPKEAELLVTPIEIDSDGAIRNPDCRRAQIAQAVHAGILVYVASNEPTPGPGGNMHVGDLDGAASGRKTWWKARVTITVHDDLDHLVADATVSGTWSGDVETASCTTDSTGQCSVATGKLSSDVASATFEVTDILHSSLSYDSDSASNHDDPDDPDDSDGTTITVSR